MSKILFTENVHSVGPELLKAAGHEVVFADRDADVIRKEIVDAAAVIVRNSELPAEVLAAAKSLNIVSKHGVGVDNIDLDYCKKAGVAVTVTPDANGLSVAEHAFALMMALAKNIIPVSSAYKKIGFAAKNSEPGIELTGKTLGLIGTGRIGSRFAKMCYAGFGMKVLAYDPYAPKAPEGVTLLPTVEEVLREADVISLHCALTDETRKMINKERLALMKPTAILINCARGPMIDEDALIDALSNGGLGGAGLDVTDPEPTAPDSPLFRMPNVIVTPHYAPVTAEAAQRVSKIAAENVIAVLSGKEPVGRVV